MAKGKKKKGGYLCNICGFEGNKKQLIEHCNKEHSHAPEALFDMIGEFGSLEAATLAYKKSLMDRRTYENIINDLKSTNKKACEELERRAKIVNIYNEANSALSSTLNLLSFALEPYKTN